jgi:hypothetical protein
MTSSPEEHRKFVENMVLSSLPKEASQEVRALIEHQNFKLDNMKFELIRQAE